MHLRLPLRLASRLTVSSLTLLSALWWSPSAAYAEEASYTVSLNAGARPRYAGSSQSTFIGGLGVRADFGNGWFIDPFQGGAGYAIRFLNGMFASGALSYDPGRTDHNSFGRPGSDHLKGMGNVKGSLLGVFTVGSKIVGETTASATLEVPLTNRERGWSGHIDLNAPVVSWGSDKITVNPSLHFGSRKYMQTYFGVTAEQSANSGFAEYSTNGGLKAASVTVAWTHTFSSHWSLHTSVGTSRLLGNAAKSPIVQNKQGYFVGTGIAYTF